MCELIDSPVLPDIDVREKLVSLPDHFKKSKLYLQPVISSAANSCRTLSKAISCKDVQQYIIQLLQLGLSNKNKLWYLLLLLRGEQSSIQKFCTYSSCRGDTVKTFNTIWCISTENCTASSRLSLTLSAIKNTIWNVSTLPGRRKWNLIGVHENGSSLVSAGYTFSTTFS